MSAAAAQMDRSGVGKVELAAALGWSRPRLDRRLLSDRDFPVISRGDQSGGWRFDLSAVQKHLGIAEPKNANGKTRAIDPAQLRDAVAPPLPRAEAHTPRRSADHRGEATARQRKDEADAGLKEDKLREQRGELVQKTELRHALATVMARLGHDLDALPEKIIRALELPDDAAPGIRAMIDQVRTEMVRGAEPLLTAGDPTNGRT